MGSLFGQVWLWSLLSFVAGVALTWLVLVRPAKKELEELEERLLTSPRPAPAPAPVPVREDYDDWPEEPRSPVDALVRDEPPRYDVAGLELDRRDEHRDELDDEHRPLSDFEERPYADQPSPGRSSADRSSPDQSFPGQPFPDQSFPGQEEERPRSLFERLTPEVEPEPARRPAEDAGHAAEQTRLLPPAVAAEPAVPQPEPTAPPEVEAFQPREVWREEPGVPEVYGEDADEPGDSASHEEEDEPERPSETTTLIPATALAQAIAEVDGRSDDRSRSEHSRADDLHADEQSRADDFHAELARAREDETREPVAEPRNTWHTEDPRPAWRSEDAQRWPDHDLTGEYPAIRPDLPPSEFSEPEPTRSKADRLSPRTEYISPFGADLSVGPEPFTPQPFTQQPFTPQPEPRHIEPEPFEPVHVEPLHFEPRHAEPAHSEPVYSEPERTEPEFVEPQHVEPQHVEPQGAEPKHAEPKHAEPEHTEPEHAEPEHAEPEHVVPAHAETTYVEPVATEPEPVVAQPEPAVSLFTEPDREAPAEPVSMFTAPDFEPENGGSPAHGDAPAPIERPARERPAPRPAKPEVPREPREPGRPRSLFEPLLTPEDIDDEPPIPPVTPRPSAPGNDQPFVPTLAPELLASSGGGLPQRPTRPANSPRTPPPAPLSPQPASPPPQRPVRPRPVGFSPSTGGRPAAGTTRYQQPEGFNPRSPFGPGSVLPKSDGMAPAPDFHVKATLTGRRYYTGESANFRETRADVWFRTTSDAEKAGFRPAP
ncbi:hypothetical protein ABZ816_11575 [Actinosynnema sp. NPDC047251]|uniref:Putative membrane protein n=1 Tax=Saccharothrix espanaensis (strain ATCC 51144 / DSM 44229 / JCM 9112 / NBRC 15066 / NRRL 15764) TaxID=1179773 RepID=K0KA91_SACES|nr:hypothetical protein [Saccharothrix espanaensis]CCH35236.1 putative membrane protein [Saccharothrix espanaensis DSM 44229]